MKIFVYKVKMQQNHIQMVGVAAENSTVANHGIEQQFGKEAVYWYQGSIDLFMQVQGNLTIDGDVKIISDPPSPTESETTNE